MCKHSFIQLCMRCMRVLYMYARVRALCMSLTAHALLPTSLDSH